MQESRVIVSAYRWWSLIRYRNRWEQPVGFRGAEFCIGRDLSLYPSVANGGFEAAEIDSLLPRVRAHDLVWDVGANIGIYSVLLARAARAGRVIAFEPVPDSRARLTGNLTRNGVSNVVVEEVALSDREGSAHMLIHPDAHGCDHLLEAVAEVDPPTGALHVTTTTGMEYVARHGGDVPDVIKVDVEGHEPEFVAGAWDLIEGRRPILMMEINPTTWGTDERFATWSSTLHRLFALYGEGDWFGLEGQARVSMIDVRALGAHAFTLILPAA